MTDAWIQITVGNVAAAALIACAALLVQRRGRHPALAHVLWLLVLVRLVTPPLVRVPLIPALSTEGTDQAAAPMDAAVAVPVHAETIADPAPALLTEIASRLVEVLPALWILGSVFVALFSLTRLTRFHRLLVRAWTPADPEIQRLARSAAARLGLRRVPTVYAAEALVTPFVWWFGGPPRIVVPAQALQRLTEDELRLVLTHELAHVSRRDHWVRWLEWAACVVFWWNPLAWFARRNLRLNEELSCDLLVVQTLRQDRRRYAASLLSVAELLSAQAIRPPAVASAMTSGGSLERRLSMIISGKLPRTPRWLMSAVLMAGAAAMPMGIAQAQDMNAVERRLGEAVSKGEIDLDQAQVMMDALRRSVANDGGRMRRREKRSEKDTPDLVRRIKGAIESGDLTAEEARRKVQEMRLRRDSFEVDKRRYQELDRQMTQRVEEHRAMAKKRRDDAQKQRRDRSVARERGDAERRVRGALERGAISYEEAERKIIELRELEEKKAYEEREVREKREAARRDRERTRGDRRSGERRRSDAELRDRMVALEKKEAMALARKKELEAMARLKQAEADRRDALLTKERALERQKKAELEAMKKKEKALAKKKKAEAAERKKKEAANKKRETAERKKKEAANKKRENAERKEKKKREAEKEKRARDRENREKARRKAVEKRRREKRDGDGESQPKDEQPRSADEQRDAVT